VLPDERAIDGRSGDHVLIAPPFIITDSELEELMGKLALRLTPWYLSPW